MKLNISILLLIVFVSCYGQPKTSSPAPIRFMVFSDPHYYDPALGTEGEAFAAYLDNDRKLLKESRELILEAVKMVNESDASFVIVPGDLTKDGTKISHTEFAKLMKGIEAQGRQVYVIPGNHDVSNGEAHGYSGDSTITMENISPEEFASIHSAFGYSEALYADEHSLSYVAEPAEGLWLLGLDACLYDLNRPGEHPHTDGAFKEETLAWIEAIAGIAVKENKRIIAFMHHGVTEHYRKQNKFYGEYVVDDHVEVAALFADLGINVVFTGHYHAQDITLKEWKNGDFIYDVETGSLVTWPCPVRDVTITGDEMQITSRFIEQIPSKTTGFAKYGENYVHSGIKGIAERTLIDYKLKPDDAALLSGQIADAFIAHYKGDEPVIKKPLDMKGVGLIGRFIILFQKSLIKGLYNDLPPADNDVVISLTGE